MKLKYGKEEILLPLKEKHILKILDLKKQKVLPNPQDKLKELLKNPINSPSLRDLITQKEAKNILIIVNDVTRPTPYRLILPPLLEELQQIGIGRENITFLVATGIHRGNSEEEIKKIFGEDISSTYKFVNHNADDPHLKYLGKLSSGNELWVNPLISRADFIITTGVIVPHYFAGFSGGRKSILPGISGRKTIEANHSQKAYGIARVVKEVEVILISSLPPAKVRKLFFVPMENLAQALSYVYVKEKYGEDFQAYLLPSGNTVVPQVI